MPVEGDHRHCKVCGKVTKADAETCSAKCAAQREQRLQSARTYRLLLYGSIALLVIVVLASYLR